MTDQPDTAAIRAQILSRLTDWESCDWNHVIQLRKDAAATILALCDALDDARQCISHANLHADCAISDMKALRAENERLRQALDAITVAAGTVEYRRK